MKKYFENNNKIENKDVSSGMKRRDFLKWVGLFSATLLAGGLLPAAAKTMERISAAPEEESYMVTGWCIPH